MALCKRYSSFVLAIKTYLMPILCLGSPWSKATKIKIVLFTSCLVPRVSQRAHAITRTPYQHRCNIMTLHRRWYDVVLTLGPRWDVPYYVKTIHKKDCIYHEKPARTWTNCECVLACTCLMACELVYKNFAINMIKLNHHSSSEWRTYNCNQNRTREGIRRLLQTWSSWDISRPTGTRGISGFWGLFPFPPFVLGAIPTKYEFVHFRYSNDQNYTMTAQSSCPLSAASVRWPHGLRTIFLRRPRRVHDECMISGHKPHWLRTISVQRLRILHDDCTIFVRLCTDSSPKARTRNRT